MRPPCGRICPAPDPKTHVPPPSGPLAALLRSATPRPCGVSIERQFAFAIHSQKLSSGVAPSCGGYAIQPGVKNPVDGLKSYHTVIAVSDDGEGDR